MWPELDPRAPGLESRGGCGGALCALSPDKTGEVVVLTISGSGHFFATETQKTVSM